MTIQWIGVLLLIGGISWVNGKSCSRISINDLKGEIKSPANESECDPSSSYCKPPIYFPRKMNQAMLRLDFTAMFLAGGSFNISIVGFNSRRNEYFSPSILTFTPNTEQKCWIFSGSRSCFDGVNTTCMTVHSPNVQVISVLYKCRPSEYQFKFTYEYFDCKTGISWVNMQGCGSEISDLKGEIQSVTNKNECDWEEMCEYFFVSSPQMDQTMFRLDFTPTLHSGGIFDIVIYGLRYEYRYVDLSTLTFTPNTEQRCWIYSRPGNCLNALNTTCMTVNWLYVEKIWVWYRCQPSEYQFKLTYGYFDCKTGKRIEPPTTTPLQTSSQSVTTPLRPTNHIALTTQANKPIQTTNAPTTQANKPIQTTNAPTTQANKPSQTTNAPSTQANKPIQTTNTPSTQTNKPNQTTSNPISTDSDSSNNSLTTILIIVGCVIAVLLVIAAAIYWKNRQQGQEENIAMSTPTHVYEEIHEPVDEGGYLSPMPNPNVSVQIPSIEEAYADPEDPDYIVPEDITPPPIPPPMYDSVLPSRSPPNPQANLPMDPPVPSNPGTSCQKPSVESVYTEPDYAPPENITAPPISMHENVGVPTSTATPNLQLTPLPNSEVQVSLMIRLNSSISCQVKSSDDRTNPDTPPENIPAPPMCDNARVTSRRNPPNPQTNLPTVSSNPDTSHQNPSHDSVYDEPGFVPPENITASPIYDDTAAVTPSVYDETA
uniref:uncharacterized protein LOC120335736 isoform X2 n=1 Tax=Styela clava TaxID=7725 RepID=UPI00193A9A0E|nr:uncharacterized protein LOC120335736 isoform X2 [Styela clava]